MEVFLKKIKLIKHFSIGIPLDKADLIFLFKKNVGEESDAFFATITERFALSKKKYVGKVDHRGFKIRKRRKLLDFNKNTSIVEGVFRQKGDKLYMETDVKGFSLLRMILYIWVIIFCFYYVGFKLFEKSNDPPLLIIATVLFQALLLFGIPYLVVRSRINRMQSELENEIYDWIMKW